MQVFVREFIILYKSAIDLRELVPILLSDRLRLSELFNLQIVLRVNLAELSGLHFAAEILDCLKEAFEELALAAVLVRRHIREVDEPVTLNDLLLLDQPRL